MTHRGFDQSNAWHAPLHDAVPGGAHTDARGADLYPLGMAPVLTHGAAARVWDIDGNSYVEYGMGLRAITLGHAYGPVVEAVREAHEIDLSYRHPNENKPQTHQHILQNGTTP